MSKCTAGCGRELDYCGLCPACMRTVYKEKRMVEFKKAGDPVEWGKPMSAGGGPGTWRLVVPHPDRPPAFKDDMALVTCSQGHECMLSRKVHSVSADGTLSPSVVCPVKGCLFHDFVRLLDWEPLQ